MSIQSVVARVDMIAAAQHQLSLGGPLAGVGTAAGLTQTGSTTGGAAATSCASALASAQATQPAAGAATTIQGAVVPQTSWNPQHKPIAGWIVPALQWASEHGWTGSVTSGYRSYSQQSAINASGAFSAPAGKSNHESTQYPGGAVDVTNPSQLLQILQGYTGPQKLVGGVLGAADPEHFSATGR